MGISIFLGWAVVFRCQNLISRVHLIVLLLCIALASLICSAGGVTSLAVTGSGQQITHIEHSGAVDIHQAGKVHHSPNSCEIRICSHKELYILEKLSHICPIYFETTVFCDVPQQCDSSFLCFLGNSFAEEALMQAHLPPFLLCLS